MHSRKIFVAAVAVYAGTLSVVVRSQAPAGSRVATDGVFTAAQATRGGSLYEQKCTTCHAARMWGADWPEKTAWDVYDTIKNYMPEDNPGSLTPQQARDVLAYILRTNKLPAGKTELPVVDEELKQIRLALPK